MKKKIFMLLALFAGVLSASADNTLAVANALVTNSGSGVIHIELNNETTFTAYEFTLVLPEGITVNTYTEGDEVLVAFDKGTRYHDSHSISGKVQTDGSVKFACFSSSNINFSGNSGILLSVPINDDGTHAVNAQLDAQVKDAKFTHRDGSEATEYNLANVSFKVVVTDLVVLDENLSTVPAAAAGVNVLVKRTLTANVWNTICLPFNMTYAQAKEVFGDGVEFAELPDANAYTLDGSSITVHFVSSDIAGEGFYGSWPYLVRPTIDVTEFSVNNVDVDPSETDAVATWKQGKTTKAQFIGLLHAGEILDADKIFFSNNKMYYSTGSTSIKGFRCYLYLKDFTSSSPAPTFVVNGEATNIEGLTIVNGEGQYYNLKGQKVDSPTSKGVYIQNGKKVVVK